MRVNSPVRDRDIQDLLDREYPSQKQKVVEPTHPPGKTEGSWDKVASFTARRVKVVAVTEGIDIRLAHQLPGTAAYLCSPSS